MRTVREFERAGATAIQLEDQDFPKRCGHLDGKALIPAAEMCGKLRAAVDARRSRETLIIARTDAVAVEGFDRAIERAALYREAGADMLFVEAPRTRDDLARVAALGGTLPLLANMVEGGKTPTLPAAELKSLASRSTREELMEILERGIALSPVHEVLIEESALGLEGVRTGGDGDARPRRQLHSSSAPSRISTRWACTPATPSRWPLPRR